MIIPGYDYARPSHDMRVPKGLRTCNPGNIEQGDSWKGLVTPSYDGRFCTFQAPEYGLRAIAKLVLRYQETYRLRTVRAIVNRWAPPGENDTGAYVQAVAADVGIAPDHDIDFETQPDAFVKLLRAICKHENGYCPYDDKTFARALKLAGVQQDG